ncbi:uncharacterized protein LOC117611627 [Osmia lignaria lignaria]|uniref:uncharacterized protein LOC117611627 n=1 Tax=Osmia lignaria lignaria TaxID=1437193 RepID=UPI001478ACF3|nr:uncharacterized protein LOC117611627 [Osmia lignaria]
MNTSKWSLVPITMLALISTGSPASSNPVEQQDLQKRHVPIANQSLAVQPYWEHMLREFVFKTISPPPPGNNRLYKRLLDAPFYAGPFPMVSNDVPSITLSRGDVYYLPNGHWLFCQEGCISCEVCSEHTHPTVKWVLRRVRRYSTQGSSRHDLQLTIIPQTDGSYHMNNLWPRSYVYVTSQGEQAAYWNDKLGYHGLGAYVNLEDGSSGPREKTNNFWRYVQRDSLADRRHPGEKKNDTIAGETLEKIPKVDVESTTAAPLEESTTTKKAPSKDLGKQRPRVIQNNSDKKGTNVSSISNENWKNKLKQLVPKLILGTDQTGQKHLVHVVPADVPTNATSINSLASNLLNSTGQSKIAYQRILRRIFDSLNSNRRPIENFLEPFKQSRKISKPNEEHQQEETKNGLYPVLDERTRNESLLHNRWPFTLNWKRQRRKSNDGVFVSDFTKSTGNPGWNSNHNSNSEIQNLTDSTINPYVNNRNGSVGFHPGIINRDDYSSSASNDNLELMIVHQNNRMYEFTPRHFQLFVGPLPTRKPEEIVRPSKNNQNQSDSIPMHQSIELKDV